MFAFASGGGAVNGYNFASTEGYGDGQGGGEGNGFGDSHGNGLGDGNGNGGSYSNGDGFGGSGGSGGHMILACTNVRDLDACVINETMRPEHGSIQ
jgi:hypothetical protein